MTDNNPRNSRIVRNLVAIMIEHNLTKLCLSDIVIERAPTPPTPIQLPEKKPDEKPLNQRPIDKLMAFNFDDEV